MRRLFPVTDQTSADQNDRPWSLDELAEAYAYPELGPEEHWLRANMVSTLDGAAQHDGRSQPISGETDMQIFGTLRALADVIVVGAETVRQEGYRPARAREAFADRRSASGQGPAAAIAVITASMELDFSLPLFTSPSCRRWSSPAPPRPPTAWPRLPERGPRSCSRATGRQWTPYGPYGNWPRAACAASSPRAAPGCWGSSWPPTCWTSCA